MCGRLSRADETPTTSSGPPQRASDPPRPPASHRVRGPTSRQLQLAEAEVLVQRLRRSIVLMGEFGTVRSGACSTSRTRPA